MFRSYSILVLATLILTLSLAFADPNLHVGGYGELHYNKPFSGKSTSASAGKLDFHRFVLFTGYQFNNWVSFNSELEVEHTYVKGGSKTGEVSVEQAYINLQYFKALGFRAGIMLVPMGLVNPYHEPASFHGVERPNVEKYIIPSTWREAGAGLVGKFKNKYAYELYLMAGMNPDNIEGKNGIRGARQKGYESSTSDYAVTGRLDYQHNLNLKAGAAFFISTLENSAVYMDALEGNRLTMFEVHGQYQRNNLQVKALVVFSSISEAEKMNMLFSGPTESIGEIADKQMGYYGEVAYDLFPFFNDESEQRLFAFARYEDYDTHNATTGFDRNDEYHRKETTFGFTYLPSPTVALKMDVQLFKTAGDSEVRQFNLGMGYNF